MPHCFITGPNSDWETSLSDEDWICSQLVCILNRYVLVTFFSHLFHGIAFVNKQGATSEPHSTKFNFGKSRLCRPYLFFFLLFFISTELKHFCSMLFHLVPNCFKNWIIERSAKQTKEKKWERKKKSVFVKVFDKRPKKKRNESHAWINAPVHFVYEIYSFEIIFSFRMGIGAHWDEYESKWSLFAFETLCLSTDFSSGYFCWFFHWQFFETKLVPKRFSKQPKKNVKFSGKRFFGLDGWSDQSSRLKKQRIFHSFMQRNFECVLKMLDFMLINCDSFAFVVRTN